MPKFKSFQPIDVEVVNRARIKPHPENPRRMSKEARKRLEHGMDRFGMLEPFLVNRQTGHVLSGHQRLLWLDSKHKNQDYDVQVSWCEIPATDEINVLALLNQPNAHGEWDTDILERLLRDERLDVELAGFEQIDLELLLPDTDWSGLFADAPSIVEKTKEELKRVTATNKEDRARERESINTKHDTEYFAVIVFASRDHKASFLSRLGLPGDERYIASDALEALLPNAKPTLKRRQQKCGRQRKAAPARRAGACG